MKSKSFFQPPGEDSSFSETSSSDDNHDTLNHHESRNEETVDLSRIQTVSTSGGPEEKEEKGDNAPRRPKGQAISSSHLKKDLLIHSLLDDLFRFQAAEELSKPIDHPEVLALAEKRCQSTSQGLERHAGVSPQFRADAYRSQREKVTSGLRFLSGSSDHANPLKPAANNTTALTTSFRKLITIPETSSDLSSPRERSALLPFVPDSVRPLLEHSGISASRYVRDFEQKDLLGKGGYGHVWQARNRLDGFDYAVKRIPLGPARIKKLQDGGAEELEALLEEVRTLARLDHRNIVRYHNAWLEFSTAGTASSATQSPRLLQGTPKMSGMADVWLRGHSGVGASEDVSFDSYSETDDLWGPTTSGVQCSESYSMDIFDRSTKNRDRRQSQDTIVTIASSPSKISMVEDATLDSEAEGDIETVPRTAHAAVEQPAVASASTPKPSSESSDLPPQPSSTGLGCVLILNIQMSLHPITLEQFISCEGSTAPQPFRHCFHAPIALILLLKILKGVAYLHSQNIVHRDLKPANILLSIATGPNRMSGSVDISSCADCHCGTSSQPKVPVYVNPRIGDFGLVGALEDPEASAPGAIAKAVGTEFYRPARVSSINPKLDVFALGVVLFELLREFRTKMERSFTLRDLKEGKLPEDFEKSTGEWGLPVAVLVKDMTEADEERRLTCLEVKARVEEILALVGAS